MKRFWMPVIAIAVLVNSACSTPPDIDQKSSTDAKDDTVNTLKDLRDQTGWHRRIRPVGLAVFAPVAAHN